MYYGDNIDTIQVHTRGSVETEFISATFTAAVITPGKSGPEAKEKARPIIDQILTSIRKNAVEGGIDLSRLQTTFRVSVHHNRNTGEFDGYEATYTIKFTGKNVAAAPAIHDALTSIVSVQADTPKYNLNDSADIHARAFQDASDKAKVKFNLQCKALGHNPADYGIRSWSIQDEEPRGKTLSINVDGSAPKPVGLEPGKAQLDIKVTFIYGLKPPTAN